MNFKEIIGPDELDWKVIPLDWKKIGKEELKLGTPMSKDGVEANDASCYGILMDDVQKEKHFQARVIVSGCVDFAKAEEYSGIKISAEAKKAIGKVWSQGGGGLTELPEGYPYKEQSETVLVEETAVEMTAVGETGIYQGRCVTELYWTDGENCILKLDGESYECTVKNLSGTMYIGNIWFMGKAMGESDENLAQMGFENTGERFFVYNTPDGDFAIMLDTAVETVAFGLSKQSETIHTMAPEFLPAGVGGGGVLRVNVTAVDGDVTNLTADKTYAEIVSAFEAGSVITAYFVLGTGYVFTLSQRGANHFLFHSIFTMSGSPVPMFLQIRNDDDVMLIESAFS